MLRLSTMSACSVLMLLMMGCQTPRQALIDETEKRLAAETCKVWLPITFSSRDTKQTQTEVHQGNLRRDCYCAEDPARIVLCEDIRPQVSLPQGKDTSPSVR